MKSNLKIKKELQETLIKAVTNTEKHCSYDGDNVLITGNTKRLNNQSLANSAVMDPDKFLWLKLERGAYNFSIDHRNGYTGKTDKYGSSWQPRPACYAVGEDGKVHHYFLSTLEKEYPGKGNWTHQF